MVAASCRVPFPLLAVHIFQLQSQLVADSVEVLILVEVPQRHNLPAIKCDEVLCDENLPELGTPPLIQFVELVIPFGFVVEGLRYMLRCIMLLLYYLDGPPVDILDTYRRARLRLLLLYLLLKSLIYLNLLSLRQVVNHEHRSLSGIEVVHELLIHFGLEESIDVLLHLGEFSFLRPLFEFTIVG